MLGQAGWIRLGITVTYLAFFGWGTTEAARAAGRSAWLFGQARGTARLAAFGFRLAFALALLGPLLWVVFPPAHKLDPFWTESGHRVGAAVSSAVAGIS